MESVVTPIEELQCRVCSRVFSRGEHVRRHELTHSTTKQFRCQTCSKSFVRKDALQRHELVHRDTPNLLQQGGRACTNCATAKVRCSGETSGCQRCQNRGQSCIYPHSSPKAPSTPNIITFQTNDTPMRGTQPDFGNFLDDELFDIDVLATTNWLDALVDGPSEFRFATDFDNAFPSDSNLVQQDPIQSPSTNSFSQVSTSVPSNDTEGREAGEFYVDGQTGRPAHVKRRKLASTPHNGTFQEPCSGFSLTWRPELNIPPGAQIPLHTYDLINSAFHRLCLDSSHGITAFQNSDSPSSELLQHLARMFWTSFNTALPLLHPTLVTSLIDPYLTIAICALGSHYTDAPPHFIVSMHEFARRMLNEIADARWDELPAMQARLLHHIGSNFCGHAPLLRSTHSSRRILKEIFVNAKKCLVNFSRSTDYSNLSWSAWLDQEQSVRLAYSAWLLDAMHASHRQKTPLLSLQDAFIPLPCNDKIWDAQQSADWQVLFHTQPPPPSLQDALQDLYISKKLSRERGEFARILIIHGLYHRLWDVSRYYSDPLSSWIPTGNRQEGADMLPRQPVWLPSVPLFSKWQNSTCDCLDVLHWQANATIGQHSGLEHPTVFHLHFARVVLLAPCEHIVRLAKSSTGAHGIDRATSERDAQLVQRWVLQHQYKARLAAIHAGVLFWHVRHHSVDGFYEAPAVALATLTLWAFATYAVKQQPSANDRHQGDTAEGVAADRMDEDDVCDIILLDRPTDDELVQQFIRRGYQMQAHFTGVGDLYAPTGPGRVLAQGRKLLTALTRWGVYISWLELLDAMIAMPVAG